MAWRDRLRRRAAGPIAADSSERAERTGRAERSGRSVAEAGGPPGEGPDRTAPGAGVPSVPGDWDGGWRRTPPPVLTVSRAPLGVSDGLAFRSDLAAWQNPSFDSGLGHALLPTAPAGLVRGVTRPATPQATRTGGGPLLLRSLRPEGADGPPGGVPDTGAPEAAGAPGGTSRPSAGRAPGAARGSGARPSGPASSAPASSGSPSSAAVPSGAGPVVARPSGDGAAGKGRPGDAPRSRGLTSGDSPGVLSSASSSSSSASSAVQRAVQPGTGPVVPPGDTGRRPVAPEIPLVRSVPVVPGAGVGRDVGRPAADGTASQTRSGPDSGRASRSPSGTGGRTPQAPDSRRTAPGTTGSGREGGQPGAARASGADGSHPSVRPRPAGPSLTVARRPAGPVRCVPALRPATLPDAGAPSTTTTPAGTGARPATPAQGSPTRAPLGAPLSELPATAVPLAKDAAAPGAVPGGRAAAGPALPVVQRRADGTSGTEGVHGGPADRPVHGGTAGGPAAPADAPHRPSTRTGARARGGLGAPLPALPPSADLPGAAASGPASRAQDRGRTPAGPAPRGAADGPADAPLLGNAGVQRSLAADSPGARTSHPGAAHPGAAHPGSSHLGDGPATPLVTPPAAATAPGSPVLPAAVAAPGPVHEARQRPGSAPRGGQRSDGGRSDGGQGHRPPSAPAPLVVARRVAEGTSLVPGGGGRPSGVVGTQPLPASRALSLLAARPLSLNTRLPEGSAPPVAPAGGRPVVAARWPATPAVAAPTGPARTADAYAAPARPSTAPAPAGSGPARPSAPGAPAGPGGRRAAAGRPGPVDATVRSAGPATVQRVPVVRPAPSPSGASGFGASVPTAAVPARSLPVTAPQAAPLAGHPPVIPGAPATAGEVPVVRWRSTGSGGGTGGTGTTVQRTGPGPRPGTASGSGSGAGDRVPPGGAAKAVPAGGRPRSASAPAPAPATASASAAGSTARRADPAQDPGLDLDDLARRLLDPVARLLRAELRRGRERTGRPHDGRR
ncbi:hypothetical protein [Streptomyces abyssomicinicus]|uniref:hypothetical protein n=1 Tax=Streptomyces abyssomicinicus TaxID=574929 RepID=UPI0013DEE8AD|nr:hypothetical protein [Streptomyces abyssomicinicus]